MRTLDLPRAEAATLAAPAQQIKREYERRAALGGALALLSLPLGLGSLELLAYGGGSWGYLGVLGFAVALTLDLVYARRLCTGADW